ncbi:MAG: hypothetical protein HY901_07045 [Deltaproteobacteria bacterium]|nr:hypothetical protein [Deltaproteobacteria bacterium]
MSRLKRTSMHRAVMMVALLAGCGGLEGEECKSGEATDVKVQGPNGVQTQVQHRVCAFGSRDGSGLVYSIEVDLNEGTLSTLQIDAPRLEELGLEARCDRKVSVILYDDPPNASEYYTSYWMGRSSIGESSCEVGATRQGDSLQGTFKGKLARVKIKGDEKEFLEVSFNYSIKAPRG